MTDRAPDTMSIHLSSNPRCDDPVKINHRNQEAWVLTSEPVEYGEIVVVFGAKDAKNS